MGKERKLEKVKGREQCFDLRGRSHLPLSTVVSDTLIVTRTTEADSCKGLFKNLQCRLQIVTRNIIKVCRCFDAHYFDSAAAF